MAKESSASTVRLLIGVLLGTSATLIGIAVWMIKKDEGAPVFVAVGGAMLAAIAAVLASQSNQKK